MNIPGYQLGREVAVGEYCSVYNALEIDSSKTVTIKFFHPELSSNPDFCRHVKKISGHILDKTIGNIIPIKKAVSEQDNCYVISDYYPCSLNPPPLSTEFTINEVLNFGQQLASSLTRLHSLGLVHGGVSTANIFFPNLEQVTLGPMSFQRTLQTNTLISDLPISMNESQYIAPEYSTGLTAKSDFYSMGIVLYEILFKSKPFVADNPQQLQFKKEHMEFAIPDGLTQRLIPLFNSLLAPNPDQRLASVDEYLLKIEECGFKIDSSGSDHITQKSNSAPVKKAQNQSARHNKNILMYSAVAGILMISILSFFMFSSPPVPEEENNKLEDNLTQDLTTNIAPEILPYKTSRENIPDNKKIANSLFERSQQQISQNNYGAALMSINNALKEDPSLQGATEIKRQIELEFEVRSYLSRAQKLIDQGKLTLPVNDNAFEIYKKVATLLPQGDIRINEGLQKIANKYLAIANNLVLQNQFDDARKQISNGLSVVPDHNRLRQLEFYINQEEEKLRNQRLQEARVKQQYEIRLKQQEAARLKQQRQQELNEKKRLAILQRNKALQLKQQQERDRIIQLQVKQQEIDRMIDNARSLLRKDQLSAESLTQALAIQTELTGFSVDDARIPELYRHITDSYAALANTQKNAEQYTQALATVNRGLELDQQHARLLRTKNEINALITEQENNKNQLPVFGTF